MLRLLRLAPVLGCAYAVVQEIVVPVVARHLAKRRAILTAAKEDLAAINSHVVFITSLDEVPSTISMQLRKGLEPVKTDSKEQLLRNNHRRFCAKWARAAKARFEFARICDDTALNRAALHRWLLSEWKQLRRTDGSSMPLHVMDLFMTDALDMCFLPTAELVQSESKRAVRKRARMEYYNERKFVEGWK
nr:hypothetical protein 1 [Ginkgo biloba tombusvirus]